MSPKAGKTAEREFARSLQKAAGKVNEPYFQNIVTETGRVRDVNQGFDILVGNGNVALVGESKRKKAFLGVGSTKELLQIDRIGKEWNRTPALCFKLASNVPSHQPDKSGQKRVRITRDWVALPLSFVEKALLALRFANEREDLFKDWCALQEQLYEESADESETEV